MSDFFILKNWKWISKSRWFWRYSTFCAIPWEFVFRKFTQILKLRGLRPYAWAYYSQNHPRCMSFYAGHFDMQNWGYLYDFTSTHAISTPVIFIFWSVFHSKPFFPSRPQWCHWYQKMENFIAHLLIYVKTLPHHAPVLKRLRKSSKVNFPLFVPRELVQVWYHFKWFLKLYNMSHSDSSFIDWVEKS